MITLSNVKPNIINKLKAEWSDMRMTTNLEKAATLDHGTEKRLWKGGFSPKTKQWKLYKQQRWTREKAASFSIHRSSLPLLSSPRTSFSSLPITLGDSDQICKTFKNNKKKVLRIKVGMRPVYHYRKYRYQTRVTPYTENRNDIFSSVPVTSKISKVRCLSGCRVQIKI